MDGTRARDGLALASVLVAVAGFCLGTYEAFVQFVLEGGTDGGDPVAYRVMLLVVLPSGVVAVAAGALALGLLGPARQPAGSGAAGTAARAVAWWGLALGNLVIALALAGGFFMFLDLAGSA